MRRWEGMRRDTAATAEGAYLAVNTRFYFEGEIKRRRCRQIELVKSASLGLAAFGPPKGGQYVALVTFQGSLEVISV